MLGMIGLEGSGFTICLGLILLLTGIVMYYCKTKISQSNHKVDSMFTLITDLHDEVTLLREEIQGIKHRQGVVAVSEDVEDEKSNREDETEFSNHPYKELIPITIDNNAEESASSQSEDDTDDEEEEDENNTNTIKMHEGTETGQDNIKVVDLGEIEDLKVEDSESEHNTGSETESDEEGETTDSESQSVSQVDYSKLQVVALKRLVSERKLATNVNKLRKAQLVQILQSA